MSNTQPSPRAPGPPPRAADRFANYLGVTLDERYQLTHLLGRGGMGAVFGGKHVLIGHRVAVKIIDSGVHAAQERALKRFFLEAQSAAAIGHPAIVQVIDVGASPSGDPYLVMEYLEGEDLASFLEREGTLSMAEALAVLEPILGALAVAHAKGIVHRDIKPGNVFLARHEGCAPSIKLIDFGIAKRLGDTSNPQITANGALLGTPAYMAPEQAKGSADVDERADLYAVGVLLYQLLHGELPFDGATYNEILYKIISEEPALGSALGAPERALLTRAIHKLPELRFQSASELLEHLAELPAWPERSTALSSLGARIRPRSQGAPSLHEAPTEVSPISPVSERQLGRGRTDPNGHTRVEGPESANAARAARAALAKPEAAVPRGPGWIWMGMGIAALALAAGSLLLLPETADPAASPSSTAPSSDAVARLLGSVRITVDGAPSGAKILYDGNPVAQNPFLVRSSEMVMPIRVEAPGFDPFTATVIPNQDTTVRVSLTRSAANPVHAATPSPGSSGLGSSGSAGPSAEVGANVSEARGSRKASRPLLEKGSRDSLYVEKFE